MIKFINEETGKEVFKLTDDDQVEIEGKKITDMKEITKAAAEAAKEEE